MPWSSSDALEHTSKADTPEKQQTWADIANRVLDKTGDEARAIREANSVIAAHGRTKRHLIARWL